MDSPEFYNLTEEITLIPQNSDELFVVSATILWLWKMEDGFQILGKRMTIENIPRKLPRETQEMDTLKDKFTKYSGERFKGSRLRPCVLFPPAPVISLPYENAELTTQLDYRPNMSFNSRVRVYRIQESWGLDSRTGTLTDKQDIQGHWHRQASSFPAEIANELWD